MSLAALGVIFVQMAFFGLAHEADEGTAAHPAIRNPAKRNSRAARNRCARSLTSNTRMLPRARSSRVVSRAFPRVSCDSVSTTRAASGTPRSSAIRRMISAILAGYAWDRTNPYVRQPKRRLAALEELCYQE